MRTCVGHTSYATEHAHMILNFLVYNSTITLKGITLVPSALARLPASNHNLDAFILAEMAASQQRRPNRDHHGCLANDGTGPDACSQRHRYRRRGGDHHVARRHPRRIRMTNVMDD